LDKKYSSCPNITLQHEFTILKNRTLSEKPNLCKTWQSEIPIFQAVIVNSLTHIGKKYSSCLNIKLQHEFTIEKPNSIKKTKSLPNMAFAYYELATNPPHYSEIAIEKERMQKSCELKEIRNGNRYVSEWKDF